MDRRTPMAALAVLCLCLGATAARAQAKVDPAGASRAFKEGQRLFESADYLGAIDAFQRAYQLRPHFLVLCNIALCFERKNDMIEAAAHYSRCLKEGAENTGEADAVRNSLKRVGARITWLTVSSQGPGGKIFVDGREVGETPTRVPVNPGSHVVEVRRPRADPASRSIATRGGEELSLELTPLAHPDIRPEPVPEPEPQPPPRSRRRVPQVWFWTATGLTVALAAVTTVLGVQTLGLKRDYEDAPSHELRDDGEQRKLLTNIFLAGAIAAGGASTVLFFFTDFGGKGKPTEETAAGVGLQGTF